MIKYIKGNLLDAPQNLIVHGVNCAGGFGRGVAGALKLKYPSVADFYYDKHNTEGWKLGEFQLVALDDGRIVVNLATQQKYGNDGKLYFNYEAAQRGLVELFKFAAHHQYSVAMPKLGCGLGGAEWSKVEAIIKKLAGKSLDVYVYEL